jgi:hypothetical protein
LHDCLKLVINIFFFLEWVRKRRKNPNRIVGRITKQKVIQPTNISNPWRAKRRRTLPINQPVEATLIHKHILALLSFPLLHKESHKQRNNEHLFELENVVVGLLLTSPLSLSLWIPKWESYFFYNSLSLYLVIYFYLTIFFGIENSLLESFMVFFGKPN